MYTRALLTTIATVTLGLFASVFSVQAANNTTISSVPFNITSPGTYVLVGDLTLPSGSQAIDAITISTAIAGPVVLDLKGHTITALDGYHRGVYINTSGVSNSYPITIRNGAVKNFATGVYAVAQGGSNVSLSSVTINSIAFSIFTNEPTWTTYGVLFAGVGSSSVNNCSFDKMSATQYSVTYGIYDITTGGNSYSNNNFSHWIGTPLLVGNQSSMTPNGLVLDRCQFSPVLK